MVGNDRFIMKGVAYAPTPIGMIANQPPYGDYFTTNYQSIYRRDLPLMRQMGVNCLRVYGWSLTDDHTEFLDLAYNGGKRPIYVIINRWVDPNTDWTSTHAVDAIKTEWQSIAKAVRNHPAILGYALGNELNFANGSKPAFWAALDSIAGAVRTVDATHLITSPLGDSDLLAQIQTYDAMTNLNCCSVQMFRGSNFSGFFSQYAGAASKPLIMLEFGIDGWDSRVGQEYSNNASLQATYLQDLWNEMLASSNVVSGGAVFSWADEWWKTSGSRFTHEAGGWNNDAFPDGVADEEWWGIHRIADGKPNLLQPRAAYDVLRSLWFLPPDLAPLNLVGKNLIMTGTSGSGDLPNAATFLLALSSGTNSNFRLAPISGAMIATNGPYTYVKTDAIHGQLALNALFETALTFETPVSGSYTSTNGSGDMQSGTFVLETGSPDFSGDAFGDLLLQRTTGELTVWKLTGASYLGSGPLREGVKAVGWLAFGTADFNTDGRTDVVFQNKVNGKLAVWYMDGFIFLSSAPMRNGIAPALSWRAVSAADFNNDGKPDILLQNLDGRSVIWFMDGTNYLGGAALRNGAAAAPGWRIAGSGDFNGDGQTDIVWQHLDGRIAVWRFIGSTYIGATLLRTGPAATSGNQIRGIGDFNLDGKCDLLWQNQTTGKTAFWFFDNETFANAVQFRPVGSNWQIKGPK